MAEVLRYEHLVTALYIQNEHLFGQFDAAQQTTQVSHAAECAQFNCHVELEVRLLHRVPDHLVLNEFALVHLLRHAVIFLVVLGLRYVTLDVFEYIQAVLLVGNVLDGRRHAIRILFLYLDAFYDAGLGAHLDQLSRLHNAIVLAIHGDVFLALHKLVLLLDIFLLLVGHAELIEIGHGQREATHVTDVQLPVDLLMTVFLLGRHFCDGAGLHELLIALLNCVHNELWHSHAARKRHIAQLGSEAHYQEFEINLTEQSVVVGLQDLLFYRLRYEVLATLDLIVLHVALVHELQ